VVARYSANYKAADSKPVPFTIIPATLTITGIQWLLVSG
jgi:hypothetical protein